jgi:hypothetical protein
MAEKKLTFEQAMARLEELVALLEKGEAPLKIRMGRLRNSPLRPNLESRFIQRGIFELQAADGGCT